MADKNSASGLRMNSGFVTLVVMWVALQSHLIGSGIARFVLAVFGVESQFSNLGGVAGIIGVVYLFYAGKRIASLVAIGLLLWATVGAASIFIQRVSGAWSHDYTTQHQVRLVGFCVINLLVVVYLWNRRSRRARAERNRVSGGGV